MRITDVGLPPEEDENADEKAAGEVCNKIPAGVGVSPDICFGQADDGDEFDDLIESAQAHACKNAEEDHAHRRIELSPQSLLDTGSKSFPGQPGTATESKGMNNVIILQPVADDPP